MTFHGDSIICYPWIRATLTMSLLRLGRFEEAQEAALPLVGTPYQAWFLYTRAWYEFSQGRQRQAEALLGAALTLKGAKRGASPWGALPRLHEPFEQVPMPDHRDGPWSEARLLAGSMDYRLRRWNQIQPSLDKLTRANVRSLFSRLRSILALAASPFTLVQGTLQPPPEWNDPYFSLIESSLACPRALAEIAQVLWTLHEREGPSLALSATACFYLTLAERHHDALAISARGLTVLPTSSILRALRGLSLFKTSRRQAAFEIWTQNLSNDQDRLGLTNTLLGILAYQEGQPEIGLRYFHEATQNGAGGLAWDCYETL